MPIRVHWGDASPFLPPHSGVWQAATVDGKIRLKWGGSAWQSPAFCRVKINSTGGTTSPVAGAPYGGNWQDSGYRGYPNPPGAPYVNSWSYTNVQAAWSPAAAGGAAIANYHSVITDVNGNWLAESTSPSNVSPNWSVSQDTRYRIYVQSIGANGLATGFVGPLNVGIGHPSTPNYGYVNRQRGWQSGIIGGSRNKDDPFWITLPSSVVLTGMFWRNLRTPMSSVVCPGTNRDVNWVFESQDFGTIRSQLGTVYSGNNTDYGFNNQGTGAAWGIVARGTGWSTTGNGYYQLWVDQLWLGGTETYANYEIVSYNPEQGNYYY